MEKEANELIHESSPYLLQHAYNPVDWHPWNEKTLALAKKENKPMLISIGYSACHWCHVMEKESFEDSLVAEWMNDNFVCIKVDREERPDVDQIYMNAVQLMSGRGGWPLNCFATSDGKPFYGGTYFPKDNWLDLLKQLSKLYKNDFEKIEDYANKLTDGIKASDLIEKQNFIESYSSSIFDDGLKKWQNSFDSKDGGNNSAPKFPMPNNYEFLLQYGYHFEDEKILNHLYLSLDKMAMGGLYDQIGGGFARYSTDMLWKVPHFEKMLYDNAQLVSLYSKAYQHSKKERYKEIVFQTIEFVERELMNNEGAFYSALDADSEGEEGKFYVWTEDELKATLGDDYALAKEYYRVGKEGHWEHKNNILLKSKKDNEIALELGIEQNKLKQKTLSINNTLLREREKRIRPGLDDKTLTSWNALMTIGLIDAYKAFGEPSHLVMAEKNLNFLIDSQLNEDGSLQHSYKDGKSSIVGFLEDYSFLTECLINMYEVSFQSKWLEHAEKLTNYCLSQFYDEEDGMFYYTSSLGDQLIARKKEIEDNVIPSSNSSIAKALFKLGTITNNKEHLKKVEQMISNMGPKFSTYLPAYTNWGQLWLWKCQSYFEVAIVGENAIQLNKELQSHYLPNTVHIGSNKSDELDLELLTDKWQEDATTIYVCQEYSCQLPVNKVNEALGQIIK